MKAFVAFAAAVLAAPAFAQGAGGIVLSDYGTFDNRGACESSLAHVRNDQRRNPETRGEGYQDLNGADFNRASRTTTRCERVGNDYVIVFYADGF